MYLKDFKKNSINPKYLYLDQNFWIYLAQVHYGKNPDISLSRILNKLKISVSNGKLIIPINLTNVIETQKITDLRRREQLAKFMVLLSKGYAFMPYPFIKKLEVENLILEKLKLPLHNIREKAFGKGILYLISDGTPYFFPKFYSSPISLINETKELLFKKIVIDDCKKEERILDFIIHPRKNQDYSELIPKLEKIRSQGYKIIDKTLRKKIGISHYIINTVAPILYQVCNEKDFNPKLFRFNEEKKIYDFLKNLPFFYTLFLLLKGLDESPNHKILSNDILDNNSYCFALPYCDYVIGENYIVSLAKRNNLDDLYSTKLFQKSNFTEIEDQIDQLIL